MIEYNSIKPESGRLYKLNPGDDKIFIHYDFSRLEISAGSLVLYEKFANVERVMVVFTLQDWNIMKDIGYDWVNDYKRIHVRY